MLQFLKVSFWLENLVHTDICEVIDEIDAKMKELKE